MQKSKGKRPRRTFGARLRIRNALGDLTRAILYWNLQELWSSAARGQNADTHFAPACAVEMYLEIPQESQSKSISTICNSNLFENKQKNQSPQSQPRTQTNRQTHTHTHIRLRPLQAWQNSLKFLVFSKVLSNLCGSYVNSNQFDWGMLSFM